MSSDFAKRLPSLITKSGDLVVTAVPVTVSDVRKHYLERLFEVEQAVVGVSKAIPSALVRHLLQTKKDGALKVKYEYGDSITNMEGAMHTLVVPVAPQVLMFGDHRWVGNHQVSLFPAKNGFLQARPVIASALVQPDFETHHVLHSLIRLTGELIEGRPLSSDWEPASRQEKLNRAFRETYEAQLKSHMVSHFTASKSLPATATPSKKQHVISRIRDGHYENLFYESYGAVLSIEMLYNIVCEQQRIEHQLIDYISPNGYIYTWDPPAIFAKTIDADILDELWAAAILKIKTQNLRMIAFNDWNNPSMITGLTLSMHVPVVAKATLFKGHNTTYSPPTHFHDCALVLHNNSDAFGQNVETEIEFTSLDGALGAKSTLAAQVHRSREFDVLYI